MLPAVFKDVLQLLLLLRIQFVCVLEQFNELLLCEFDVPALNFSSKILLSLHLYLILLSSLISTSFLFSVVIHLLLLHLLLLCLDE